MHSREKDVAKFGNDHYLSTNISIRIKASSAAIILKRKYLRQNETFVVYYSGMLRTRSSSFPRKVLFSQGHASQLNYVTRFDGTCTRSYSLHPSNGNSSSVPVGCTKTNQIKCKEQEETVG